MGKAELKKMTVASIVGALFVLGISTILQWVGFNLALISAATSVLLVIFRFYDQIFDKEDKETKETEEAEETEETEEIKEEEGEKNRSTQDEKEPLPRIASTHSTENTERHIRWQENRSRDQSPDAIRANWKWAGTSQHSNLTISLVGMVRGLFNELPIPESRKQLGKYWGKRVAISLGVLSYLWMFLIAGRILDDLIGLPSILQPVVSVVPSTFSFMSIYSTTGFLYFALPAGIIAIISWYYATKFETTCHACEETFSLIDEGRYYRPEDVHPPIGPHRKHESSFVIDGKQILRCKSCGREFVYDIEWEE